MDTFNKVLQEINLITMELESKYPEIYKFIDEDTLTLPFREHPKITIDILLEYLDNLRQLLQSYKKTHFLNGST